MTVTIPYYFLELLFLFFCLFFLLLFSTIFSCFNCKIFRLFKKSRTEKLRRGWLNTRIKSVVISGEGRQTTDDQETQRSRGRERETRGTAKAMQQRRIRTPPWLTICHIRRKRAQSQRPHKRDTQAIYPPRGVVDGSDVGFFLLIN